MDELITYLPVDFQLDQYRIERVLGVGGFGITYKGYDTQLRQRVAIKEYLPAELAGRAPDSITVQPRHNASDDYRYGLERFLEEARTLAQFRHPNIVRVTRFLEANGTAYLVMDYEEGGSLSSWLKAHSGPVPEEQLKAWFVPILRGLVEVHRAGFLHRDIKPGNIYLRDNGEPLLIDFGAARQAIGEHSRSVTGIISAGYAPTEQYGTDSKKQGPWTDLYAVAATLYRCISGNDPIDSPTRQSAVMEGDPDPLVPATQLGRGQYSVPLLQLIDQLLVLPIKQRPQSTEVVLAALEQGKSLMADHEPRSTVVTRQVPRSTPASSSASESSTRQDRAAPAESVTPRHAPRGAIAALLVLLLGGGGYWAYTQSGRETLPLASGSVAAAEPPVQLVKPTPQRNPKPDVEPVHSNAPELPTTNQHQTAHKPDPQPMGQLTLNITPADAKVVLPDIGPRYQPGMSLKPGRYRVQVAASGYEPWSGQVLVTEGSVTHHVDLTPKVAASTLDSNQAIASTIGSNQDFASSGINGCKMPDNPIIPDGRYATLEEMLNSQRVFKMFQSENEKYRDCLDPILSFAERQAATQSATAEDLKLVDYLIELYNASVGREEKLAEKYNMEVRNYKENNPG